MSKETTVELSEKPDGNVQMPVIAYAYDDPEYGFPGSPCKRFHDIPPGRAKNSEPLVRQSDAQAALAGKDAEIAALKAERDALKVAENRELRRVDTGVDPFGHFKAEPFGWTNCAETGEGDD